MVGVREEDRVGGLATGGPGSCVMQLCIVCCKDNAGFVRVMHVISLQ